MARFRSSRTTRNNDPATLNRNRGVIDHDPTEGLPVRNWYLGNVTIKQDEPAVTEDTQQVNANTINPDYPWPELPLPSFFTELPPLSQQLVRIARSGRPVKPSVYDKKTGTYISHADYAARNALKSKHLENVGSPAADEDEDMDEDLDVKAEMEKQERIFTMRKWAQVPPAVADRRPEPKYLADRRPGMPSLYGIQAAALNPALNTNATALPTSSFDLGDGSGLGNATGVLAAGMEKATGTVTPVKRMPPKRKKKGGPGRKKANLGTGLQVTGGTGADGVAIDGVNPGADGRRADGSAAQTDGDTHMEDGHDDHDNHDDGSGSEEEGSEEGEIDESHPHDAEMKMEDVTSALVMEPAQPQESSVIASTEEISSQPPAETVVDEIVLPPVEAVQMVPPVEPEFVPLAPVEEAAPELTIEELNADVDLMEIPELVPVTVPAPAQKLPPALSPQQVEPVPTSTSASAPAPTSEFDTKPQIDLLGSLDTAIAAMEKEPEITASKEEVTEKAGE